MARLKSKTFTEVELQFMHVIWESGEAGTEEIQLALRRRGKELTDGSIRKILGILVKKGHLTRRKTGRTFLYRAAIPQEEARVNMVQDLVSRGFQGSPSLMMAALLESRTVKKRDMERIRRMIAEYGKKGKR